MACFAEVRSWGKKSELSASFLIDPHLTCSKPTDFVSIDEKISSYAVVRIEDYTVLYFISLINVGPLKLLKLPLH